MLQYIFSTTPILLSTYVSSCIDIMVSSAGVNMILAFLKKDIISGAKQLLWTGRVSDVQRRNKNIHILCYSMTSLFELYHAKAHDFSPTWWNNALSSCDLSDYLFDSWPPMPSLCIFALIEAPTRLRFSEFFLIFIADFRSHLGKWVKLIKIEALNMGISTLEG